MNPADRINYEKLTLQDIYEILGEIEQYHNVVITMWTKEDFTEAVKDVLPNVPDEVAEAHAQEYWDNDLRDQISDDVNQRSLLHNIVASTIRDSINNANGIHLLKAKVKSIQSA
jgi:hypothetical protein